MGPYLNNLRLRPMIKKVLKASGRVIKPFVNFPHWMGLKRLVSDGKSVHALAKEFFSLNKKRKTRTETFEEAKLRLRLTEQDLANRMKSLLQLTFVYLLFAIALLSYTVYLVVSGGALIGIFLSIMLTLVAFAMSYRENFWYFQMKKRRLGCSFKEWLQYAVRGGK